MDDVTQLHAKERKYARKNLLKKIDSYNKQLRKTRRPSFPLTGPSKDLVYKGVVKVSYDRGYALQTKSLLIESSTTASEVVEQLFDALGLRGSPTDYALEERNARTGEIRVLSSVETPLNLQLNYAPRHSYMELRLVQMKDTRTTPAFSTKSGRYGDNGSDSSETSSKGSPNLIPKEEVIDHGIASVELVMEEALQDIPPLVYDIQQRLKVLSETVAVDGKPRTTLPNRRMLWDVLKPQASALVKDIRRLVDNGEFLANRHCTSHVIKHIATLLLELITDHSRELVTVTKEMCGLRGAVKTEFSGSVSGFIQQITYISKLVGKVHEALHAMTLVGHLLDVTAPENFQQGRLQPESYFTGSGNISGVLIFTVVSAYLGLVRAAYEEKKEYYTPLAANMLRSAQRAQEVVQKTDGYTMLHLHPLRSRVRDMEHKLKVAMDNTIRGVKVAAASRPPPVAATEMLLYGHALIMAVLDFLMVAQCASLLHKVVISGWDLLQFPWIKSIADTDPEGKSDSMAASTLFDQLSSLGSDSTGSQGDGSRSSLTQKGERERRSRIPTHQRESGDGMDAAELAASTGQNSDSPQLSGFGMVGLRASQLKLPYYRSSQSSEAGLQDSSEELRGRDDDIGRFLNPTASPSPPISPPRPSNMEEDGMESEGTTTDLESQTLLQQLSSPLAGVGEAKMRHSSGGFGLDYAGIDAVKKLRLRCNINKAIARGAESLLLTVTQKINVLSAACREGAKEKYSTSVELIVAAARQITEEVSTMEMDLLVGQSTLESLEKNRSRMEVAVRDVQLVTLLASSSMASESSAMKLMAAVGNLKDICSKTVGVALATAGEHRKSLDQAERIDQEFISLMTGQKQGKQKTPEPAERKHTKRLFSSPAKLAMAGELDTAGIVFEATSAASGGRGWTTKETPKLVGGTVPQLVHRLTYHKMIDSEFADTFLLTFYRFMTPEKLLDALSARYNLNVPADLSSWEEESFQCDVTIPVRLRVIHALRAWLNYSYDDFKNEALAQKLKLFIQAIAISLSSCAKQLQKLLEDNLLSGPAHLRIKPHGQAPTPLVPMGLSHEESFDLLDVNTLELARQVTLVYSMILREIRPQELISLGWMDGSKLENVPNIMKFLQLSRNLSQLICKEVAREPGDDDQASVLSYFIHTAKSCLDLKNFEAVFAIMKGLQSKTVQQAETPWHMLSDHVMNVYEELTELVSPEIDYHRYRLDVRMIHQSPAVPHLRLILSDLESIDKDHLDYLPETEGVVNFQKCRQFAKAVRLVQKYQSIPYSIHPIEVMQRYLSSLKRQLSGEELEQLSTKVEALKLRSLFQ